MQIANVSLVTENKIFIRDIEETQREQLQSVGIQPDDLVSSRWVIQYVGEIEKATLFTQLRDIGIAFSTDTRLGWGPAEQFEEMRDRGIVKGNFKRVSWRGPQDPFVIER